MKRKSCEYSSTSPTIFPKSEKNLQVMLAYLNSKVSDYYLAAINPSITTNVNDILAQPDPLNILSPSDHASPATPAARVPRALMSHLLLEARSRLRHGRRPA